MEIVIIDQIIFEIEDNESNLFTSKTCIECENNCKISCISKDAKVLCSKYKKDTKLILHIYYSKKVA